MSSALDRGLALQLQSELEEEGRRIREVLDNYTHVIHPFDRHGLGCSDRTPPAAMSFG